MTRPKTPPVGGTRTLLLVPFAVVSGAVLSLAFMPTNAWPLAFVAVAGFAATVARARRLRAAIGLGVLFGVALLVPSIMWQALITVISFVALAAVMTGFYAALGGLLWLARGRAWTPWASAGLWVAVEALYSRWPFGGFGWLRLGYSQIDSPLAGLLPFGGVALVSLVVALIGHLAASLGALRTVRAGAVAAGVTALTMLLGAVGWLYQPAQRALGDVHVGYVQGGAGGGGLYGLGPDRDITRRHVAETAKLMNRVDAGTVPKPAFIVLPENTTDRDPFLDTETAHLVNGAAEAAGVPLLVGVPVSLGNGERKTSAIWWTADGAKGEYQKRNLVPFGEYVPFRDVFEPLVPELAYVGDQSIPGTLPGVIDGELGDGAKLPVGSAICYDVAYPDTVSDLVRAGAHLIVVQSNNAMFGRSAQVPQQFAITRARAAELRREVLVVTTSGLSGLIGPTGQVMHEVPWDVSASGVVTMPLRDAVTPFVAGGWLVEPIASTGAVVALLAGVAGRRQRRGLSDTGE